jgi:hypothetical protein
MAKIDMDKILTPKVETEECDVCKRQVQTVVTFQWCLTGQENERKVDLCAFCLSEGLQQISKVGGAPEPRPPQRTIAGVPISDLMPPALVAYRPALAVQELTEHANEVFDEAAGIWVPKAPPASTNRAPIPREYRKPTP